MIRSWPLRAKLVFLTALLLTLALTLSAFITSGILSRYLIAQVDDQLTRTASNPALLETTAQGMDRPGEFRPSGYYVLIRDNSFADSALASEGESEFIWPPTQARYGVPDLPWGIGVRTVTVTNPPDRISRYGAPSAPFTVPNGDPDFTSPWRVVVVQVQTAPADWGAPGLSVYLALPLASVEQATSLLTRTLALTGLCVITLGSLAAFWLVRRSLRPLQQIERVAADIATDQDISGQIIVTAPPNTEVGSLQLSLNTMLAALQESFAAQQAANDRMRQFVSDASHELRTPLAVMRGYSELYRLGGIPSDAIPGTFARIEDAAGEMSGLVEELLTLARLDEGRPLTLAPVDLTALVHDAAQDLAALDPDRPILVRILGFETGLNPSSTDDSFIPAVEEPQSGVSKPQGFVGDETRLRQVMTNLIANVAAHTPAGSPIELTLSTDDSWATIQVIDHGLGVTPDDERYIFERFYRTDASRSRESGGSGLGLAIVAAIVAAHQGTVTATPTPNGGLTITLKLPILEKDPRNLS